MTESHATEREPATPVRNSAGAIVAPAVVGVLAALLLLAAGHAPTVCDAATAACATPGDRLLVAVWWTVVAVVLATLSALLRLRGGARRTAWSHAAFGGLVIAALVGCAATLGTGGSTVGLLFAA